MENHNDKILNKSYTEFNVTNFCDNSDTRNKYINIIKIFSQSNFNICYFFDKFVETDKNERSFSNTNKFRCMIRYIFENGNFYFLFFNQDKNMFLGVQSEKEMIELNLKINPSLEFNDSKKLNEFLQTKIFTKTDELILFKDNKNIFFFESLIDIIKVYWEISTLQIYEKVKYFMLKIV